MDWNSFNWTSFDWALAGSPQVVVIVRTSHPGTYLSARPALAKPPRKISKGSRGGMR